MLINNNKVQFPQNISHNVEDQNITLPYLVYAFLSCCLVDWLAPPHRSTETIAMLSDLLKTKDGF